MTENELVPSLNEVKENIETSWTEYNHHRIHASLNDLPTEVFCQLQQNVGIPDLHILQFFGKSIFDVTDKILLGKMYVK